jgi:hypothetical protein
MSISLGLDYSAATKGNPMKLAIASTIVPLLLAVAAGFVYISMCTEVRATEEQCKTAETLAKASVKLPFGKKLICPEGHKPEGFAISF